MASNIRDFYVSVTYLLFTLHRFSSGSPSGAAYRSAGFMGGTRCSREGKPMQGLSVVLSKRKNKMQETMQRQPRQALLRLLLLGAAMLQIPQQADVVSTLCSLGNIINLVPRNNPVCDRSN